MITKITAAFALAALFSSCAATTSTTTTSRDTLADRVLAKRVAANSPALPESNSTEPAPPAAGPEDVANQDPDAAIPDRNPALVPTPLLRYWASSRTP